MWERIHILYFITYIIGGATDSGPPACQPRIASNHHLFIITFIILSWSLRFIIFIMAYRGVFERRKHYEMVEKVGLYWHFVDLVWVFVFTFYYLI